MRTAVITGATSGIGLEVCKNFLQKGIYVIGVATTEEKAQMAEKSLDLFVRKKMLRFFAANLAEGNEVRLLGQKIKKHLEERFSGKLDILINNAGCVRSYYTTTSEGFETQFAVNCLAGYILTGELMESLIRAGGRILFTSSNSHKGIKVRWQDIMFKQRYNALFMYKQTKLCNLLLAYELNKRYNSLGVRAYRVDPGLVNTDIGLKNTTGIVKFFWNIQRKRGVSPSIAAKTFEYICEQKIAPDSLYYFRSEPAPFSKQVNAENSAKLWDLSEKLTGFTFKEKIGI